MSVPVSKRADSFHGQLGNIGCFLYRRALPAACAPSGVCAHGSLL